MKSQAINIILPNQLFKDSPLLDNNFTNYIIEESLFFRQFNFHKQKIAFHRASMKYYESLLASRGKKVKYIESHQELADLGYFINKHINNGVKEINFYDPVDNWISKKIYSFSKSVKLKSFENPLFINQSADLLHFFKPEKKFFAHAVFYKQQRKRLNILMNSDSTPVGGKFSFDEDNRKRYPKEMTPPSIDLPLQTDFWIESLSYVKKYFSSNFGLLNSEPLFPVTHEQSNEWFNQFLSKRFSDFGDYEDAIVKEHVYLNHSILTPLLNSGLLSPHYVLNAVEKYARDNKIKINSHEGFVRQIIGWREFIRGMYVVKGTPSRNKNFWGFNRKIPKSFYEGTTGITPIDDSIKKTQKHAYCHHIERLMVLGNFMLLCEFDPDEVYRWFMEVFIDSYDWVMVPNVYGMSQFADGGFFATKPYISSSNYIRKMSNYKSGEWSIIWDALFWNFIKNNSIFFKSNPRLSMMFHTFNRMKDETKSNHVKIANDFLNTLNK